ncbi:MAG TPA: sulfatase, partial [Gemmataceae bacterium]|nr:sulfatase [Gemmataceae bacterium]
MLQFHRSYPASDPLLLTRRWFFQQCGVGLGAIGLADLLGAGAAAAAPQDDPLAPRAPHFAPKAKNVIFLFMAG